MHPDELSSTANCASYGTVDLLARPCEQLKCGESVFGGFEHTVLVAGNRMSWAPYSSRRNAYLFVELDDTESISSGTFHHADVNAEAIRSAMCAADMNIVIAALKVAFDSR